MKDDYGRPTSSLRISITQSCDLNCFYCHREGCVTENREMTAGEIARLVEASTEFGVEKVKITGGEPLVREDLPEIIESISLPEIEDVSMTTNAVKLEENVDQLTEAGLDRVNVSLDTLNSETYEEITGRSVLDRVLKGIESAQEAGLQPIKLNALVLKGVNDGEEIEKLMEYSLNNGVILQLIELEKVLPENEKVYERYHKDLDPIEEEIRERASEVRTRWLMQARRKYIVEGGEVEVVNPMHNTEFCEYCTRLRVTSGGYLKPCLMRNDNLVDVLTPIREGDEEETHNAYRTAIKRREPYFPKGDS